MAASIRQTFLRYVIFTYLPVKPIFLFSVTLSRTEFLICFTYPSRVAQSVERREVNLYSARCGFESHSGRTLVADARDQQPFEPGEWGLESCSLRAFLREPPCRTCKKHPAGIWLQDYGCGSPDQNKQTNKQICFTLGLTAFKKKFVKSGTKSSTRLCNWKKNWA